MTELPGISGGLAKTEGRVRLSELPAGAVARVANVAGECGDAVRLKSLGICVGRRIQLIKSGDPLVVRVLGARVGLSVRLAACVSVAQLED
jgi:Fe2+ transport system protein FeoA